MHRSADRSKSRRYAVVRHVTPVRIVRGGPRQPSPRSHPRHMVGSLVVPEDEGDLNMLHSIDEASVRATISVSKDCPTPAISRWTLALETFLATSAADSQKNLSIWTAWLMPHPSEAEEQDSWSTPSLRSVESVSFGHCWSLPIGEPPAVVFSFALCMVPVHSTGRG